MVNTRMEGRVDGLEARMAGVEQGIAHFGQEFTPMKDLMMETINEMRNARRTEERGKAIRETPQTPSQTATERGGEKSNVFEGGDRFCRLDLPIFAGEDPLGWVFQVK